jgi:YggT family protein
LTYVVDVLNLFLFILIIRIVLSYVPASPGSALASITRFFEAITEPVLRPIRRLIPPVRIGSGTLDLSPIIVWLVILIVSRILVS